jgi:hypothetical protein
MRRVITCTFYLIQQFLSSQRVLYIARNLTKQINNVQLINGLTYKQAKWNGVCPELSLLFTSGLLFISRNLATSRWPFLQ